MPFAPNSCLDFTSINPIQCSFLSSRQKICQSYVMKYPSTAMACAVFGEPFINCEPPPAAVSEGAQFKGVERRFLNCRARALTERKATPRTHRAERRARRDSNPQPSA